MTQFVVAGQDEQFTFTAWSDAIPSATVGDPHPRRGES
jgi:hypothetical protein